MTNIRNLLLLFVSTLFMLGAHAKIWRVNNNTGVVADFTTFTAAVNSASVLNGDTIHIEPSATSYGGATISKRLVVIGAGYLLNPAAGGNAGLQVSTNTSMLASLTILDGANGSRFSGIYLENTVTIGVSASTYNLLFEKCNITSFTFAAGAHDG